MNYSKSLPGKETLAGPKPSFWPLCRFLILTRPLALPLCLPWLLTVVTHFQSSGACLWPKKLPLFLCARARGATGGASSDAWQARTGLKAGCEPRNSLLVVLVTADKPMQQRRAALDDNIEIMFGQLVPSQKSLQRGQNCCKAWTRTSEHT